MSQKNQRRWWHHTPVLLPGKSHGRRSLVGCSPWGRWGSDTTDQLHVHFSFHALEKEMATHSSILAWRIPWTEEPGVLQPMGSQRVGHNWANELNWTDWTADGVIRKKGELVNSKGEAMAPHSSPLAWKIPWTEESGGLQSMESQRVGHNWANELNWTELNWAITL